MKRTLAASLLALFALAAALPLAGCGQAQAETLEVTYYYLPG